MTAVAVEAKTIPLIEAFGPTVQGEGFLAGLPTLFLRFGLCDFRCVWCDSKYAVEPEVVKRDARRLTQAELADEIDRLDHYPGMWVTFSGGNPAMHDLGLLTELLQAKGLRVSVETQGSVWKPWLETVDHLTISPKPPSSGMVTEPHTRKTEAFFRSCYHMDPERRSVKIVVFNNEDFAWARGFIQSLQNTDCGWKTFLSVGTNTISEWDSEVVVAEGEVATLKGISERYAWLCEKVAGDETFARTHVYPQLHVIAWGHAKGV